MSYIGDFNPGDVFDTKFTTVTASGAPVVFTGSAAVSVYKGNSVTQSTAGVTLSVDFDGLTGSNNVNINTGADGTFYAAGNDFQIVATAGTAGGISLVGYVLKEFSIQHRSPLRPTTASRTLNVASTGQAGVNWADVANPTTTVGLTNTTILTATADAAAIAGVQADLPIKITKNVALAAFPFFMVTSATHTTGAAGLTVTAQRSLDGAALAACANAVAEIGSGYYSINLAQTDTNANTIGFLFTAAGADPLAFTVVTQPT